MGIARGSIDYRFPSPLSIHSTPSQVPTMRPFSAVTATAVAAFAAVSLTVVNASPLAAVGHLHEGVHRAPLHVPNNPWAPEGDAKDDGLVGTQSVESNLIPDQYIVVLKEDMGHALPFHLDHLRDFLAQGTLNHHKRSLVSDVVENIAHHFDIGAMKGYAGRFSQQTLEWIRKNPAVAFVEQDSIVRAMDIERGAPWGLARISHRKPLSLSTLGKYEYAHNGGAGVDVYVIDTGINIKHVEFEGRAKWGKTMPANDVDADGNGHGSHVAGTIASAKYGVAKDANLIAVKVLGSSGSGSMSDVVGGVAWAAQSATQKMQSQEAKSGAHKGSVANMSLGGGKSPALDLAVNNAVKKGLHFAVAAGNDNRDACSYSPAGAENAITVGASTISDSRAYFSNFGKCVDLFGPGLNILSTWNTGERSINTISGTSMASPHVAGLAAYYLSLYGVKGGFAPEEVDYETAGVPYPGSIEEQQEEARSRSLFQKGQLVFGGLLGKKYTAPTVKPLDPRVLKQTMLRLSTKGALTQVDSSTPNLLIFNNYTNGVQFAEEDEELLHAQPIMLKAEEVLEHAVEEFEEMVAQLVEEELAWLPMEG